MKMKKVLSCLVALTIACAAFYFQKRDKIKEELVQHNTGRFEQMKKTAQKSSAAGMLLMASAINKYNKKNGRYPDKLLQLCPDYIPDKTFITELNWKYTRQGKTYTLKKHVTGQPIIASLGPDLKLTTQSYSAMAPKTMLASVKKNKATKIPVKKPRVKKKIKSILKPRQVADTNLKKSKSRKLPDLIITKRDLAKGENFLSSFSNSGLYIWKSNDGHIGFSDVQYPNDKNMSILKDEGWLEYTEQNKKSKIFTNSNK